MKQKRKRSPKQFNRLIIVAVALIIVAGTLFAYHTATNQPDTPLQYTDACVGEPQRLFIDWINYGKPNGQTELYAECADGKIANLSNSPGRENSPQISPDGKWIAYDRADPGKPSQVWVMGIDGSDPRQITRDVIGANVWQWFNDTQLEYSRKTIDSCKLYRNNIEGNFEVSMGDCY